MSEGAIERIKYKINADEEACSTWNGKNASVVFHVRAGVVQEWGNSSTYPSSHHQLMIEVFEGWSGQNRRSIARGMPRAATGKCFATAVSLHCLCAY